MIKKYVLGVYNTNTYILADDKTKICAIIDPADNGDYIVSEINNMELIPKMILLTHGHFDHIYAIPHLQEIWPDIPVYCNKADILPEDKEFFLGQYFPTLKAFSNLVNYEDGDEIQVGELTVKVMMTPGHTEGSAMFFVEDTIFSGDTLFHNSVGRTDFLGGSVEALKDSLNKIKAIQGDYKVYPGHGCDTTLKTEKLCNPFLM